MNSRAKYKEKIPSKITVPVYPGPPSTKPICKPRKSPPSTEPLKDRRLSPIAENCKVEPTTSRTPRTPKTPRTPYSDERSPTISIFIKNNHVVKEQVNQSQAQAQVQGQGQKQMQEQHLEEKKESSQGCMGVLKKMICGS